MEMVSKKRLQGQAYRIPVKYHSPLSLMLRNEVLRLQGCNLSLLRRNSFSVNIPNTIISCVQISSAHLSLRSSKSPTSQSSKLFSFTNHSLTHHQSKFTLKMRLQILTLLALATTGLATRTPKTPADPKCKYVPISWTSVCNQGNNLFCTGNADTGCQTPKVGSTDVYATELNEISCDDKKKGEGCYQYHCCK